MQPNVTDEEINRQVQKGLRTLTEQLRQRSLEAVRTDSLPSYFDSIRESELPAGSNPSDSRPIISNPQDLLSTGLTKDKSMALGFLDADGNATSTGQLFYNLKQRGVFDETGVITPKGRAYLVEPKDLYEPENLDAYITQFDDGLTRQETTWGEKGDAIYNLGRDVLAGVGQGLLIGGKNAYYNKGIGAPFMLLGALSDTRPPELKAETTAMKLAVGEKLATNLATLNLMVDVGLNWAGDKIKDPAWWGESGAPIKEDSRALYAARQRQDKLNQTIADFDAGEVAEVVAGIEGAVGAAEQAREVIGKDAFNSIYKKIGAATEVFGGAENAIPGVLGFKLARSIPIANRLFLTAQRTISKVIELDVGIEAIKASLEATAIAGQRANVGAKLATRFIDEGAAAGATPTAITRGQQATDILARTTKIADETVATSAELTAKLDELTKARNSLATKIPEAAAQATAKTLEAGRNLRAMPANLIGSVLEGFGTTLTKVDDAVSGFLKEKGFDQMYTATLGAAGVVGLAGSPVIGAVAAGAAALKTGKMFANYGKMFKYVGKEMAKVRGQIPFWQRVASHTAPGSLNRGIAHTFNMLDLGGVTSDTLRRIPRGVAAAYPADLMFEWLSDGADMRPETFSQAAAESLFIGGSFAAAGGAFMGTKRRMRELSIGDQLNFLQNMTDGRQKALYNTLPKGVRSAVATYGIANPTLIYEFKESGSSEYDPNSNTATINVRSNNPIRPLIAHETLHHTIVKNNMEGGISALFLGDTINNTVGGLLRSRDGKLDPNFEAFRDRYYQRLNIAGMTDAEKNAIYPLEKVAVEYFIEQHSDQYAEMAESGELGAIAASGDIKRKLSGVLETVLPRIPVLRDLHFKSGGMIDKNGGWVTGNGILDAEGVRTNPITNKMFRDMNRRSSGRSPGQFDPLVSDKQESGAQITLDPTKAIDSELLHPLVKVDENGRPVLVNGQPVALDKATLLERALAGLTAKEVLRRKKAENYIPEKGEAYIDELGEYVPGWLSNNVLSEMFAKNRFNPEQKRIIREVNRMIREGNGGRAVMINFPATTRNKSGKAVYKPQGATLRDTVPVAITISKDGNLLFGLMSVTKLQENIKKRSQSRLGKKLYGGNVDLILRDTQAMMQFHKDGVDSIEYFKSKYGAVEADERKKFINTMFGLLNKSEQAVLNPMLIEDGVKSKDNVYRTYRADRVSKAVAMSPEDYPAMPFSYEAVSQVKMPEQARQMPEVAVVPERFTGSATDTDRRGKYVEPPGFFRKFNIDSYERGGRFFDAASGEDLTGKQYSTGSIDVSTGKPRLFVDNVSDATPSGSKFKTNLFKQRAGWKWTSENPPPTSTIVSVEGQGKHIYTLKANFEGGVELARYSEKASEPRLRPTGYGDIRLGNKVGEISIRGKAHPVYDSVGIIPKVKEQTRQMSEKPITSSSEEWKSMSNKEKDAYVFAPVEMTPSNRAEFDSRVKSGSLSADTPVVDINRSNLLTSKYGPPSSSATGNINTWIDDDTGKPVAVAFSENGNIPTRGERKWNQTPRYMPEKEELPIAKTSSEVLQEKEQQGLNSTGIDIPELVDDQSVISNAIKIANSQPWQKGRDFKLELQRRVLEAAEIAGVDISERTLESIEYLSRVGLKDALIALEQNPNAIGWYDEKTKEALGVMSLLFPEIATDENARFAFTWALAVTSNGLKVDKNFELAERVYRQYRKTGKMPTDIKAGQAQKAINKSLDLFNQLTDEWGINNTRQFMQTEFTVGEISRLGIVSKADKKEVKPGGEHSDTIVRGSAILGPKIGNGFFSNLYGLFDALTMDRWLVRTWGRWTGTLVEFNPELTQKAKTRLEETLAQLTPDDKSRMDQMIGKDVSSMTTEDLSVAIQKASMKPKLREVMNTTATGEEFRMAGNGLAKYLDGQKEAPANPTERNFIREIFGLVLDELKSDAKYADLTMADLQAVLWYAEKRLYETAKVKADQDAIDSSDADGYEDDEAPDYANAAIGVARNNGVSSKRINEVLEKIKNDNATITQPSDKGRSDAETKQQEGAGGFVGKQKQKFKHYIAVTTTRRNRTGNEKALWSYSGGSGKDSGDAGILKPRAKKNLGVKYISEWKPGRKLANIYRSNDLPTIKFLELDSTDAPSAQKFADTIQQSKDSSIHGASVYVYPVSDYKEMKLFLSDSGKSGFAVKSDGDIVSVFSMEKGSGRSIMEAAISAGGKKLDAFDTILPEFYGEHGFVEAARIPWNDEFAPDGWDKQVFSKFNNGEPDVVMMVLDPEFKGEYEPRTDIYTTDYDQAVEMQNALIKKVNKKQPIVKSNQAEPVKTKKKSQAKGNSLSIANAAKLK